MQLVFLVLVRNYSSLVLVQNYSIFVLLSWIELNIQYSILVSSIKKESYNDLFSIFFFYTIEIKFFARIEISAIANTYAWDESPSLDPSLSCIESQSLPCSAISSAAGETEEIVESERRRRNQDGSCVRYNAGFLAACSTHLPPSSTCPKDSRSECAAIDSIDR